MGCVLALVVAGTGCTAAEREHEPTRAARPDPSESAREEPTTRPLVLATNARRPPLDLTVGQARRIQRGEIADWRRGGGRASPLGSTARTDGPRPLATGPGAVGAAD